MKLRYLHLSNYPPIKDMAVRFASGSPLQRECAIRFVVGVNGSGKSNLLRAVAEVFLALVDQRVPQFPVSLVYELGVRGTSSHRTLVLDCPGNRGDAGLWVAERFVWADDADAGVFETELIRLRENTEPSAHGFIPLISPGDWPSRAATPPQMALPSAVLAYTTGAMPPWQALWNGSQNAEDMELEMASQGDDYDSSRERPAGWTVAQESANQNAPVSVKPVAGDWATESAQPGQNLFRRPILLTPALLKCALLAVLFKVENLSGNADNESLTTLLQRGGWHHLVSVAFRSRLKPKTWPRQLRETAHDWLLCAGEVIAEPHPTESHRTLFFDLRGEFKGEDVKTLLPYENLEICTTQGDALRTLIGGQEATQFELFTKLVELHQAGLFDDVELRLRRHAKPDGTSDSDARENDMGILRFEELSDGEQMVLGRMALFHLLTDQQDALLLLDEPETHFNDKWKREIVDIIDGAIGKTANDVLIATHSAIVLSDVFNDEIVMVQKTDDGSTIRAVTEQTFATDPSALMMTVFEADDSIGKRAQEFIEEKLRRSTGAKDDIVQLERLIARMGSGFYRSELRTLLNTWKAADNA